MKPKISIIATLVLALALSVEAKEKPSNTGQIEFDLLVVQLPEDTAMPLVSQLRDSQQSAKATDRILELITANQAILVAWPVLTTFSGQRAVVEQLEEFRYATQYTPGERAKTTEQTQPVSAAPSAPVVPVDPRDAPPDAPKPGKIKTVVSEFDVVPASFETRNLGVTLEVEPVITNDGRSVSISLLPQHISLLEMRRIEIEDKSSGKKTVAEQPRIQTNKVTTSLTVNDGDYTLLGTFKLPKPEGTIELFILHTQIKKLQ
jgi:hypothetical protein